MAIKHHWQPKRIRVTFDECTLVLHMWICIFTYIYTYTTSEVFSTIQTSSTPVCSQTPKYPACMSTISKHFITCPCITHQCTSEYLMPSAMHYNTLPKPLHICRCTSFNIPNIPGTLCCISKHLPGQNHTYTKYPALSIHAMQNICRTFPNIWTSIHLISQHF